MSRQARDHAEAEGDAMDADALAELVARVDAEAAAERAAERAAMDAAWEPEGDWPTSGEIAEYEANLKRKENR